eukprot:7480775-Ditylum_brightwellii.AAC.1
MGITQCNTPQGYGNISCNPFTFALVVDDFGIKINGSQHGEHFINALKEDYEVTIDYEGKIFCGIHLDWDYNKCKVDLAMPGYTEKARTKYGHQKATRAQYSPHKHTSIQYGTTIQWMEEGLAALLTKMEIKQVQDIVGTLLYYSRAVNPTLTA